MYFALIKFVFYKNQNGNYKNWKSMAFVKVYIHYVWSTKNRFPFLDSRDLRSEVWNHIGENARQKNIFIDFINGYSDHCHCLVSLGVDQSIQKVAQLIKGESSFWINSNKLTIEKFAWQEEYFAVSVSESMLERLRQYIKNQEMHHSKKTFQQEYDQFICKYGFERFEQ